MSTVELTAVVIMSVAILVAYWLISRHGRGLLRGAMYPVYDCIVIGGGNAGCCAAARLAEGGLTVLLLEAGAAGGGWKAEAPLAAFELQKTPIDWQYRTTEQPQMGGRRSNWPRGKVLGGCSTINWMIGVRGSPSEYDEWETKHGCSGWSYQHVLPFFRKLETYIPRTRSSFSVDASQRGTQGPVYIKEPETPLRGSSIFLDAAREAGYRVDYDYNAGAHDGAAIAQLTIKDGRRVTSADAYLLPEAAKRPDQLHVLTGCHVTSIDHETKTVTFVGPNGQSRSVKAHHEIVLCAGAVGTPQLLMLSGIGDKEHLNSLGIEAKVHLPGVGLGLQDHLFAPISFAIEEPVGLRKKDIGLGSLLQYFYSKKGPLASQGLEAIAFKRTERNLAYPDLQLHFVAVGGGEKKGETNPNAINMGLPLETWSEDMPDHVVHCMSSLIHPKSKGSVRLQSKDPFVAPVIDPRYLSERSDVDILIRGFEEARKIMSTTPWRKVGAREIRSLLVDPSLEMGTPQYDEAQARAMAVTIYHPTGTCKMGPASDPLAVCDEFGRVHGTGKGLRVADLSLCPEIPGGNTMLPAYMIAEKIAHHLLKELMLHDPRIW